MKETLQEFDALCERSNRYFVDGETEKALDCYRKALGLIEGKEGFNQEKLKILNNIGIAAARLEQFEGAIKAFSRARDISEALGDKHSTAWQTGNIGSVFRDMKEYDSALQYYQDALTIFEKIDDISGMASQYSNVAYIHAMKGEKSAALKWFEKAKTKFEVSGNHEQAELALQNMEILKSVISSGE
jgi:tetratricopeptide (TPR) repeat protein